MNLKRLLFRSLQHYFASHLATAAGIAIATAVICGALIIGDSLKFSLNKIVGYRLGDVTHSITAGERVFTKTLAQNISAHENVKATAVLKTEAIAMIQGGGKRANRVQLWGIDSGFTKLANPNALAFDIGFNEAFISSNLAAFLNVDTGDFIQLHIRHIGAIPLNTPFVSEDKQRISRRVLIKKVLHKEEMGHFNLQSSQSAPYNVFVNIDWLNRIMDMEEKSNMVLLQVNEDKSLEELKNISREAWQAEDGNLTISSIEGQQIKIASERVFIDAYMADKIKGLFPEAAYYLTYFVNSLRHGNMETPYSFVSAMHSDAFVLEANEVMVNEWLAADLQLVVGDTLFMTYYEIGPLRELTEHEVFFIVSKVLSMDKASKDHVLMPHLPGLSDAGSCRDWETGIPVNLNAIRQKDEDYWRDYKGTPKAYISLERGQELWQNRFGKLTGIILPANIYQEEDTRLLLGNQINPFRIEFQINELKKEGVEAAENSEDFGQLFAGLGMFIIIAGLLLAALMLNLSFKRRQGQIRLYASLGFSKKLISRIMAGEMLLISLLGNIAGLVLSIVYSRLVLMALNTQWHDIVRTDVLLLHFNAATLTAGVLAGIILSMAVMYATTRKAIAQSFIRETALISASKNRAGTKLLKVLTVLLFLGAVGISVYLFREKDYDSLLKWFFAGLLLFLSILSGMYLFLKSVSGKASLKFGSNDFVFKNLSRQPARSFAIVVLLAIGSFVIVLTAANRESVNYKPEDKTAGHGGFLFMAETTMPVLHNLSNPDKRLEYGLSNDFNVVQFSAVYDDDASCLNLNMVANPRIIATNPANLDKRFSFATRHKLLDKNNPWLSLNMETDGLIPAIADQTVIKWGLGKKIGDTLVYINARGEEIALLLIGGLSNSIFQGNVLISEANFLHHFPTESGSHIFLIEAPTASEEQLKEELEFVFRDYGWDMENTSEKLASFNAVQNTYLSIFSLMGALGMLIGTIGLIVFIARSLLERRSEMALLSAMGYPFKTISGLYFKEYGLLFLFGVFTGTLSAIIATLPSFLSGSAHAPISHLILIQGIIIAHGMLWIFFITAFMIRKLNVREALRND